MDEIWKDALWSEFGATIDMLGAAMDACPDELWTASMWNDPEVGGKFSGFWYVAYHTLFWLDCYLTGSVEGFSPPAPYTLGELDPRGLLPERVYAKDELQSYRAHCRHKCQVIIEQLTDEKILRRCVFPWRKDGLSFAELLLDNMRHVQEHCAQLNMFLGQQAGFSPRWLTQASSD